MESIPADRDYTTPSLEDDPALGLPIREKMEILFAVTVSYTHLTLPTNREV